MAAPQPDKNSSQTPARRAGVIGYPISHSLSPRIHGFWLKVLGIDASYCAREVTPNHLAKAVEEMREEGFLGFNVTLPHKETILPLLDHIDPLAREVGAVNTVVYKEGKTFGYNTDVYGFAENLKTGSGDLSCYKSHALILGAGGASRAVIQALLQEGFEKISLANRTLERAHDLRTHFGDAIDIIPWHERRGLLSDISLLVNTTSQGMKSNHSLDLPLEQLSPDALVTDIVYNPLMTPLLTEAQARGNPVVDGLGMLLYQAQAAFEYWFGVLPPVTKELRSHVLEAL